ncbi:response regulator transcription factor [Thalassotalea sp. M1531]|uniref:Response regulator transcription factor n=1 Tax=Thalassotalea algicola TaxID=2716224 RepID=A0A7Y0LEM1_9GAMM|nr:response regulator transcription factor [Thalassotalea algicola]NMP33103.1 response regulator transcription factor [Thalassotalea algicola]
MIQPEKLIIADDHPLFRQALLTTLQPKFLGCQWLEAETISELENQLGNHADADLLILDLNIPGGHGFNNLVNIRKQHPQIPVVIISAHEDNDTMGKAIELGAVGFIPKSTPVDTIYTAIIEVLAGKQWLPSNFRSAPANEEYHDIAERVASLTQQQHKILMMFAEGMLNKQIAYDLNVSEATIKAHATAIFKKLNVRNRTQAVIAISNLDLGDQDFNK